MSVQSVADVLSAPIGANVTISGEAVSLDRYATGWVATRWEQGLPVDRRPIPTDTLAAILQRCEPSRLWLRF